MLGGPECSKEFVISPRGIDSLGSARAVHGRASIHHIGHSPFLELRAGGDLEFEFGDPLIPLRERLRMRGHGVSLPEGNPLHHFWTLKGEKLLELLLDGV